MEEVRPTVLSKTTIHPGGSGPATADDDETSLEGRQREAQGCGRGRRCLGFKAANKLYGYHGEKTGRGSKKSDVSLGLDERVLAVVAEGARHLLSASFLQAPSKPDEKLSSPVEATGRRRPGNVTGRASDAAETKVADSLTDAVV